MAVEFVRKLVQRAFPSAVEHDYAIHVKTGDKKGAGTDANVYVKIFDEFDKVSTELHLNVFFRNDFESGSVDTFPLPVSSLPEDFASPSAIEIRRDNFGIGASWFVEYVTIERKKTPKRMFQFPVHRWIKKDQRYLLHQFDVCLPQENRDKPELMKQRREEIGEKRRIYRYKVNHPGLPAQVAEFPEDEQFSSDYKFDIIGRKAALLAQKKLIQLFSGEWNSIDDMKHVYKWKFDEPKGMLHWDEDWNFAAQRIRRTNNITIKLCKEIPKNFQVTEEMVSPFLEGRTLDHAIAEKRLFLTDFKILKGVICKDDRVLPAPLALFYLNEEKVLKPVAIQLFQWPTPDNPVFLPTDPKYTWLAAKMWYNSADAQFHQSITHLGTTHLLMESIAVCTHRNLSPSHPIFKLLAPHFLFLIAINSRGLDKLINPDGWVDQTMTLGCFGMFELMKRGVNQWRMDVQGTLPRELAERGFFDMSLLPDDYWLKSYTIEEVSKMCDKTEILPGYYWRDDALQMWECIKAYVIQIVLHHYESDAILVEDSEIQNFADELVAPKEVKQEDGSTKYCGCGLEGVPGNGTFVSREQLVHTLTSIVFTCSVSHAASFCQYDEYGFPPNYPGIMYGRPPTNKAGWTESNVIAQLPKKMQTLDIMVVTKLLSEHGTNALGDFEVQYLYDPESVRAAEILRTRLQNISNLVKLRNRNCDDPFRWLDPDTVPNAISI